MSESENKILGNPIVSVAVLIAVVAAYFLASRWIFFSTTPSIPLPTQQGVRPLTESEMNEQARQLETLRKEAGVKPLTEAEMQEQAKALDALRREENVRPLTQAEMDREARALDQLRGQVNTQ